MCANLLPLYLSFILLLNPVCYILNCYFVVGQEPLQLVFTMLNYYRLEIKIIYLSILSLICENLALILMVYNLYW